MTSTQIGKLDLQAEAAGVKVRLGENHTFLTPQDVSRLTEFLEVHAPHERRVGFRVPLTALRTDARNRFHIALLQDGRGYAGEAVDLSLTGALLELDESVAIEPVTRVRIRLGSEHCELVASVVRRDGRLLALHFLDALRDGELDPPESLLAIFRQIEQAWLQSRINVTARRH